MHVSGVIAQRSSCGFAGDAGGSTEPDRRKNRRSVTFV